MNALEQALADRIRDRGLIPDAARVLVGFSGGTDSLALLASLAAIAPSRGWDLHALYVDHGLRADSATEGQRACALAASLGVPCRVIRVAVPRRLSHSGEGLEGAARTLRHRALRRVARRLAAAVIALGHTADDRLEGLLLRIARGAGPGGLVAIPERRVLAPGGPALIRPLLATTRAQLAAYCAERGLVPVEDPSNADEGIARNRIRHRVVPELRALHRGLPGTLARGQDLLADEEAFLAATAWRALGEALSAGPGAWPGGYPADAPPQPWPGPWPGGVLALDRGAIARMHPAIARRVVRLAVDAVRGQPRMLDSTHVEAVRAALPGPDRGHLVLPGAVEAVLQRGLLAFVDARGPAAFERPHAWGGIERLPGGWCIESAIEDAASRPVATENPPPGQLAFDLDALGGPLVWRLASPRTDRFTPWGHEHAHTLEHFFSRNRVAPPWRDRALVLASDGLVAWVGWPGGPAAGRRASLAPVGPATRRRGIVVVAPPAV